MVALVSGGKDSVMSIMMCQRYGHQIVALANLLPATDSTEELDSFMYQTVRQRTRITLRRVCLRVALHHPPYE